MRSLFPTASSVELEPGSPAPDLQLDTTNDTFQLAAYRGQQHVLLYFMRTFDCPVCMGHVARLARLEAQLAAQQIAVVVFGPGDEHEAARLKERLSLRYTVVADHTRTAYLQYGLDKGLGGIQRSGSFLLDREGVLRYAVRSTLPTGALREPALMAAIAALPAAAAAEAGASR
jgi:peroxiredoxin